MPIKGISDVDRLPRIGKIRLGIKVQKPGAKYSYPEKTDYFVMDPDDKAVLEEIKKVYGDKPRALDIMFASDDVEQLFPQYLKRYSYGTLMCKGDGNTALEYKFEKKMVNGKETSVKIGEAKAECKGCQHQCESKSKTGKKIPKRCKPLASLMVLLPKIPGIGVWQLDTGSYHSIVNMNAGLKIVKQLYKRISGIPLKLLLSPRTVNADGRAKVVYVISLSIEGTLENALKSTPQIEGDAPKTLLPAPEESNPDDHFPPEEEGPVEEAEEGPGDDIEEEESQAIPPEKEEEYNCDFYLKIIQGQVKALKVRSEHVSSYIVNTFKKKKSTDLDVKELKLVIDHLAKIIDLVTAGLKSFTMKELEDYSKKMYKKPLLELAGEDLEAYTKLMRRSSSSGKEVG